MNHFGSFLFTVAIRDADGAVSYDAQANGGYVEMTLAEDGSLDDGDVFVPAGAPEVEEDMRISFEGTWSRSGNTITLDHEADLFIEAAEWTYDEGLLRGEFDEAALYDDRPVPGDTTEITVVMERQAARGETIARID